MSDIPPIWGFLDGTSSGNPDNVSDTKDEEMPMMIHPEPSQWASTSSATESSDLSDIFRALSDFHFQEPSLLLTNNTKDDLPTTKNPGAVEHGEPSNSTIKRNVDELEFEKISEGNEQLMIESKREEQAAKRKRSTETHNMSERKRRSRINEKIKTLQELIPNSEKKDCASILDEAIRYLKALKDHAAQQMMSMGMSSIYCNPYTSATGIPLMQVAQYSPYGPFRPGMRFVPLVPKPSPTLSPSGMLPLVPMSSPTLSSSGMLPLVPRPTELCPSLTISGTSSLPTLQLQPTYSAMPNPILDDKSKEGPQKASTSGTKQIISKPGPSSIVHATHFIPPATEEPDKNKFY